MTTSNNTARSCSSSFPSKNNDDEQLHCLLSSFFSFFCNYEGGQTQLIIVFKFQNRCQVTMTNNIVVRCHPFLFFFVAMKEGDEHNTSSYSQIQSKHHRMS
jgi:hypothetical protein